MGIFPIAFLCGLSPLYSRTTQRGDGTHRQRGHLRNRVVGGKPDPAKVVNCNFSCFDSCCVGYICLVSNCGATSGKIILNLPGLGRIASIFLLSLCTSKSALWAQLPTLPDGPDAKALADRSVGSIGGVVFDPSGAAIAGATVSLTANLQTHPREAKTVTGPDGRFTFLSVEPGPFHLVVRDTDFADGTANGMLRAGETADVPPISLVLAPTSSDVNVTFTDHDLAAEQIKVQETQRLLGAIPNFYVSYAPDAVPLTPKQKFSLAWKQTVDPASFVVAGVIAGVEQAANTHKGYAQGAEGYAKRYGAVYADYFIGTTISSAILPSLLKQDPRYLYKGTGTVRSRTYYAIANSFICKGDNHRWQANYSSILGDLAAGGISNLYYPAADRNGLALTFENAAIGTGARAAANLMQEFLFRRLTPNSRGH